MSWFEKLVCPYCKKKLKIKNDRLECPSCQKVYPIKNGIPIFIEERILTTWDASLYSTKLTAEPLPPHKYYTKFATGWKRLLDVGCGDGVMSAECASMVEEIFCVDPGLKPLQILKKRNIENMYPVCTFGERLPFPDSYFDGVFNIFVVEHIKNPIFLLKEIHRVLKEEGELIIATDTKWYDKYTRTIIETIRSRRLKIHRRNPTHINLMVPSDLRNILKKAGFDIINEDLHYFVGRIRFLFPKFIREQFLTSMFVFKCKPLKQKTL